MATVLVIGDTHCPAMRTGYVRFLQGVAERYGCNEFVHIGDLVDWHSISYHERLPGLSGPAEEFRKAFRQVQQLHRAFPKCHWLIGNHDSLTERQATTAGLPANVLRGYADLWEVGWKVHPRFSSFDIDGVSYSHGENGSGGKFAAQNQASQHFKSIVIGHYHSQGGVSWYANREFRVFGMSVGCGIDHSKMQFDYGRRIVSKPILGCGVVESGKRAYFEPWLLKSR